MGKYVILTNGEGEQVFPATTASQVSFDGSKNMKQVMDEGRVQTLSGGCRRMFYYYALVKTNSSGVAYTQDNIKQKIEALAGKWDSYVKIIAYSTDSGVTLDADMVTVTSDANYGKIKITAYEANGSKHYDSGSYANTGVILLIFTD